MRLQLVLLIAISLTFIPSTSAEETLRKVPVSKGSNTTRIVYASSPWNLDPAKIDSAFIFIREPKSGKIAKVILDESQPDSSTFSGSFSLNWGDLEQNKPHVYIPPQNLRGESGLEKFKQLLVSKKIPRKPVVFRRDEKGNAILDVYDTKEQAMKAMELIRQEKEIKAQNKKAEDLLEKAEADTAALAAATLAEEERKKRQAELEANKREAERIRLEQLEKQKAEARLQKMKQMAAAEKKKLAEQAVSLANQAMGLFKNNDFVGASGLFEQAVDLDPENKDYYLNYAIALFRQEKYNDALVILNLIPEGTERDVEKKYYTGLSHYHLKDYPPAVLPLTNVKDSEDKVFGPSAAFYLGLIEMENKNWDASKTHFEHVLDTSSDPVMDSRAEAYIESILAQQAWDKQKKHPFTLTGMLGLQYDSNVLLSPDGVSSQGSGIEGDARGILMGQLQYRALYERTHEWVPTFLTYYQYSSKSEVSAADVFLNNLSLPYLYKGMAWGRGYRMTFKPAYEVLNMDINEDGSRENILNSIIANVDNTFVMSRQWFASYIFEVRQDDSLLPSSTGDDDYDSMKYTLKTKHLNFIGEKSKKILQSYFGLIRNEAAGKNKTYNKVEAGATFMKPLHWWESTWSLGLALYHLDYPDSSNSRTDFNSALSSGITRPVNEWLTFGVTATYTNNNSDVSTNQYSKYVIMTSLTSKNSF